jgi:hypothetical protein
MFSSWKRNYIKLLRLTRVWSQVTCFLLSMFAALSLYDLAVALNAADAGFLAANRGEIRVAVIFHVLLIVIFTCRFFMLSRISRGRQWFSQLLWLVSMVAIYSYMVLSTGSFDLNATSKNCMDCFYYQTFRYSSVGFTEVFLAYLFLSPFKEILFAVFPIFGRREQERSVSNV